MTNDISFALTADHQPLIQDNNQIQQVFRNDELKSHPSYLLLSADEKEQLSSSDFQDPLFYQQPLDFHYDRLISTDTTSENVFDNQYPVNNLMSNSCERKRKRSIYGKHTKSNKSQHQRMKTKKKKAVLKTLSKRKSKNKKNNHVRCKRTQHEVNTNTIVLNLRVLIGSSYRLD